MSDRLTFEFECYNDACPVNTYIDEGRPYHDGCGFIDVKSINGCIECHEPAWVPTTEGTLYEDAYHGE